MLRTALSGRTRTLLICLIVIGRVFRHRYDAYHPSGLATTSGAGNASVKDTVRSIKSSRWDNNVTVTVRLTVTLAPEVWTIHATDPGLYSSTALTSMHRFIESSSVKQVQ
jgi:hypothetical protein